MLDKIRSNRKIQLLLGFLIGIAFGFLLQRGGVTRYEVIMGQLLLKDWTVMKVILTAILTGMLGIYALRSRGWVKLHRKKGSFGSTVIGGLLFGVGFGLLGYCPGTMAGAIGQGSMDALIGGALGMLIGTAVYASVYPFLKRHILQVGNIGDVTLPELLHARSVWAVIFPVCFVIAVVLLVLENIA